VNSSEESQLTKQLDKRIFVIAVIVLAAVLLVSVGAFAGKKASKKPSKVVLKSKLGNVQQRIREVRYKIQIKESERRTVTGQLSAIERDLSDAQEHLFDNKIKLFDAQTDLDATIKRLAVTKRQLTRRQNLLTRRIVDIYEGEDLSYMDVVLGSTNMWTFLTRSYYLQQIIHSDTSLISDIRDLKASIERDKAHQTQRVTQISALQTKLEQERNQVASLADKKQKQLDTVEHDKQLMEQALDELEQESHKIEDQIKQIQNAPVGKNGYQGYERKFNGGLLFPCTGRVTSPFGYRVHPITGVYKLHTGVDISVPIGTPIHAAGDGKVIIAGWNRAYGYMVIIDHGNHVSTLYGHNSHLLVSVGEIVHQGQVIARSGSTGFSTGPHCHFEKRVDGAPVNPGRP